jgi:hypothetical protein
MKPIRPEEISKSYWRVCNHDFHDVVDKYHTPEQRDQAQHTEYYMLAVRGNDTLDAIDEEQPLHSFHLIACSIFLEQFVCSLTRVMKWDSLIEYCVQSDPGLDQHQGAVHMFTQFLLGALDFASDPTDHMFLQVPLGRTSLFFLSEYFMNVR